MEEYTRCCRRKERYIIARWKLEYGKYEEAGEVHLMSQKESGNKKLDDLAAKSG
jgi:hypothetical protein